MRSVSVTGDTSTQNSNEMEKGRPRAHSKIMEPGVTLPRVYAVKVSRQQAQQESEGFGSGRSLTEGSRDLSKTFFDHGGHVGGRGLVRGYGTHNALWRGRSLPGTHVGDFRPSVQRSSLGMRVSDIAALTNRVNCCSPAALFTKAGKGMVEMRATSFRPSVTYARGTDASCLAFATASAVAIAAARACAHVEDTGLARSPVTDSLLSRSAEDATSTKEEVTCLFPATTVTSPWSVLEAEDKLKEVDEPYPLEGPLTPSRCPPLPPPCLLYTSPSPRD